MWLLEFHMAFSILCALSSIGAKAVFTERFKRFKRNQKEEKKKYQNWLLFFCPGVNLLLTVGFYFMAFCSDEAAQNIAKEVEKTG